MVTSTKTDGPAIVVIGAGCGGLAFTIALQRKYGFQNFVIFEKASDLGGTWRANTYPGCTSDIAMHFFSLSSDLRNWHTTHAHQPVILSYWRDLAHKYSLLPHIRFNHTVLSAEWDDTLHAYHVTVNDHSASDEGKVFVVQADVVVSAIGILDVPHWPKIKGIDRFKGEMFHSARWNDAVKVSGKNVAVVGNGPSAIQIVPQIASDATSVTNFIRSPSWLIPSMREKYSSIRIWLSDVIPGALWMARAANFLKYEASYFLVFSNSISRRVMQSLCKLYIQSKAPAKYYQKLIPNHQLGCGRTLYDTEYLKSLHRPNVSICWDGIAEIVEDGIITTTGDMFNLDIIIMATGFVSDDFAIPVKGRNGMTIREYYRLSGGPTAYLGTSVPNFPNFFTLLGPNIATSFTSIIYSHELQIDYILQLIQPILAGKVTSLEVKSQATDDYNAKIQQRLSKSVFMQCLSWYRTGGDGKVSNIFPGSGILMWWWLRRPVWDHYQMTNGQGWEEERKSQQGPKFLLGAALVSIVALCLAYTTLFAEIVDSIGW